MNSVAMPQLGESVSEGTVVRWLKRVGEPVAIDEPLFEVATDKVNTDIPSLYAGVLGEILVAEGTTVPVGTERLRLTPSPVHSDGDIDRLVRALSDIWSQCALSRRAMAA